MASVIIPISKKTPLEELVEKLTGLNENFVKPELEAGQLLHRKQFLDDIISCMPLILNGENRQICERFALIGFVFVESEEFQRIVKTLEQFESGLSVMQALAFLYGIAGSAYNKFLIFRAICRHAGRNPGLQTLIQPHLLKVEEFIKSWSGIPEGEMVEFIEELLELSVTASAKTRLIFKVLEEFTLDQEVIERLIAKLIRITSDFDIELLIETRSFHSTSEIVKDLVKLLSSATTPEVIKYWAGHEAYLGQKGFNKEKVLEIARVAGLVKLISSHKSVSFAQVAEKLGVKEEEVDYWVVRAVSNGMIKARIDGLNNMIFIDQSKTYANKQSALSLLSRFEKLYF